ncbi:MAG: SMC-Scp complex subunit ScpB [Bacillota bacterium]|nr:SMC-Scp complex subunit ScpB [Bacillota bacterium]MDD3851386.1 SMC-Scp complex subunit ScpB [Bacillota bacterium]MDD4707818.1 SMC-Scp complex subunit ScpB [Bacillota bacterium]
MDKREMKGVIEAVLFAAGDPVSLKDLCGILGMDKRDVLLVMKEMKDWYNYERRGLQLIEAEGYFQFSTRPEYYEYIQKLHSPQRKQGLSQAALETLAIIAYKQPITRAEVDSIRGVQSDSAISTLIEKRLIHEVDRMDTIGRPILYGTTVDFLKYFGLSTVEELPEILEEQITYLNENTR